MTACLNSEGDKDEKIKLFIEAKRLGIRFKLPHVNLSDVKFSIQNDDKGDFIRIGLNNIKYLGDKMSAKVVSYRPFRDYEHFYDTVDADGSGLNARVISSCNAVGAAEFPDNPRRGNEHKNYYEYLKLPSFKTDLSPELKASIRPLDEYTENEAFVVLAMIQKIDTGPNWIRAGLVDETGTAGVFLGEGTELEPGQMYALLIANNRVARYASVDELSAGSGGTFRDFLEADGFPDIPDEMWKVISFQTRKTKAGKRMANVVLAKNDKSMIPAMVFPQTFMRAYSDLKEGNVVDVDLKRTNEDDAWFVDRVL
jgi:DNA polymerase-3 subunit alpha